MQDKKDACPKCKHPWSFHKDDGCEFIIEEFQPIRCDPPQECECHEKKPE